ncbi:MAG: PTS transporter subunit EIIC [Erysipelotrichaceae bacterium]|nr:PTS transporter subunit EIIC [Erysipelotrichaceae bacterium]
MKKIVNVIKKIFSTLCDCIVPVLPIMIGAGMIKVLLIIFGPIVLGLLNESDSTYIVLQFVADAGYYFMPIYIGFASAEIFHTQKYLGALIGAMLLAPTFVELVNSGVTLDFLKLPIALTNYGNQILPSIIAVWLMSYLYRFLDNKIPQNLKSLLIPLITVVIMIPVAFCLIGPLGVSLSNKLIELIMLLKDIGPLGNAIMCAMIPFITIFGLSGANVSSMLLLAATGCDPILFFSNVIYNCAVGFVTFALYLRDKKPDTLAVAITSTVAGTSEPAVFSILMKDAKAIAALVVGDFFGGLYAGFCGIKSYAMASFGMFGVVSTISQDTNIIHAIISVLISCVIGFVLCLLLHPKKHE